LKQSIASKQSIFDKYFGKTSVKGAIFNLIVAIVGGVGAAAAIGGAAMYMKKK